MSERIAACSCGQLSIAGASTTYTRRADRGNNLTFHFCPHCGSTVYWAPGADAGLIVVALGASADPSCPAPRFSVWESARHPWTERIADIPMEHSP